MRRGSIDGLGRGADEVGFGCCEPQRLGAARETTASRRDAWLGIALGATLNIPEKQNGFPNQKFSPRRARQTGRWPKWRHRRP